MILLHFIHMRLKVSVFLPSHMPILRCSFDML